METARIAADSQLTARPIRSTDPVPTDTPKASAAPGSIRPDGSGRLAVRFISASVSASHRSEEHTSELQSLMRISYAVFCLKKKKTYHPTKTHTKPNHT